MRAGFPGRVCGCARGSIRIPVKKSLESVREKAGARWVCE